MPGRGEAIYAMYVGRLRAGLDDAMEFLGERVQESLNVAYPPSSEVGEPPHKRTGNLQRNVDVHETELRGSELVGGVGVSLDKVPYAGFLEFGTARMGGPRPFLRVGLYDNEEAIRQLIVRKV